MFLEKNKKKIVDTSTITKILKSLRGKKRIIMCHGNFDIVHPGHIRHLSYAKSKADILIVSITSDKSVLKKKLIPTLPDNLRANNLAALNMVDYVIIDKNSHPYKNISKIKPDFFAKGYEYKNLDNIETKKELKVVEKYGGKLIFSPGDLIFSSTCAVYKDKLRLVKESSKRSRRSSLRECGSMRHPFPGCTGR